mmetsp:Transcript_51464/g.122388  ORF Transcript_51464/g.122388 Transcript_51464/m.122388 type:complete len:565 (+) Transcript_51464:102-1796(+)
MACSEATPDTDYVDFHPVLEEFDAVWGQRVPQTMPELQKVFDFQPAGLKEMFAVYNMDQAAFFKDTLPFVVKAAASLRKHLPTCRLKKLEQGSSDEVTIPRPTGLALLAHMFLCTTCNMPLAAQRYMPENSFVRMLRNRHSAEVAKLRMVVEFFNTVMEEGVEYLSGELRIYRQARGLQEAGADSTEMWRKSERKLLEMEVQQMRVGFEDAGDDCVHADFANKMLGGGVLSGGCVQEEIRFAICPELIVAMLVCPVMLDHEAIFVVGAQQFSDYKGYGYGLKFAGRHRHENGVRRDADGTPLVAIAAMDALDYRYEDNALYVQMQPSHMLRELEKATAAFTPVNEEHLRQWEKVATGNWGCGVFRGFTPLKAMLQWLAASQGERKLVYFPFDEPIRDDLLDVSQLLTQQQEATVGQLFGAVLELAQEANTPEGAARLHSNFFDLLRQKFLNAPQAPTDTFPLESQRPSVRSFKNDSTSELAMPPVAERGESKLPPEEPWTPQQGNLQLQVHSPGATAPLDGIVETRRRSLLASLCGMLSRVPQMLGIARRYEVAQEPLAQSSMQ